MYTAEIENLIITMLYVTYKDLYLLKIRKHTLKIIKLKRTQLKMKFKSKILHTFDLL